MIRTKSKVRKPTKAERKHLFDAGLPEDYPSLNPRSQRQARLHSLTSWFDPDRPHVFCTDQLAFVRSTYLWCEYYMKSALVNKGVYYFDDPTCKYQMVHNAVTPAKEKGRPSKVVMSATRRLCKTQTFVIEIPTMVCCVRPFSTILISEFNDTRTMEEVTKIKTQVQDNEKIEEDFGGRGSLYKRDGKKWTEHHLIFTHLPGVEILAHSIGSAQRGRGPILGIWDDPETDKMTFNRDQRRDLFHNWFNVFVKMFHWGGFAWWIGTPIHRGSCLQQAQRGESEDEKEQISSHDSRFNGHHKFKYPILYKDKKDKWVSVQPERWAVETVMDELKTNRSSTMAELLCDPVSPGSKAFTYDPIRHGFMRTDDDLFVDLLTGETKPWREFMASLKVFGAADLADGESADACLGAIVIIGIDPFGIIFVLDVFAKQCRAEFLIEQSCIIGEQWGASHMFWEKAALLVVVNRNIERYADELRRHGKIPPQPIQIENAGQSKIARILSLRPLFTDKEIRYLQFESVEMPDGVVYTPAENSHRYYYQELVDETLDYTDEGISGPDDPFDALELVIRGSWGERGEIHKRTPQDDNIEQAIKFREAGFVFDERLLPPECRSRSEEDYEVLYEMEGVIPGV